MPIRRLSMLLCLALLLALACSCSTGAGFVQDAVSNRPASESHGDARPAHGFKTKKRPYRVVYDDAPVYHVPVKNISEAAVQLTEGNGIPPEWPESTIDLRYIIDESRAVVARGRDEDETALWPPPSDILIYDFISGTLGEPLNTRDILMRSVYADTKYVLAETTDEPMVYMNGTLVLFDIEKRTETTIFHFGVEGALTGAHPHAAAILDDTVYFDDFVYGDTTSSLYSYDIASGEVTLISESGMSPTVFRDDIWYLSPDEDGKCLRLCSLGGEMFESKFENMATEGPGFVYYDRPSPIAAVGDKLYTTYSMGADADTGEYLTGVYEWFTGTAVAESRKENIILPRLQGNNDFIVWQTYMPHQPPCIYDAAENTVYEFTDYARSQARFFMGKRTGVVILYETDENDMRTGNEKYYIFTKGAAE